MGRYGENIRKRADGRWEARVVQGAPRNGKTNYKYLYAKTYEVARRRKLDFLKALNTPETENSCVPGVIVAEDDRVLSARPETPERQGIVSDQPEAVEAAVDLSGSPEASEDIETLSGQPEAVGHAVALSKSPEASEDIKTLSGQPEASEAVKDLKVQPERVEETGVPSSPSSAEPTMKTISREWLASKKPSVKESTHAYYTTMVNNHVIPGLGKLCVKAVTAEILSTFFAKKKTEGGRKGARPLSDKTLADLKAILKQILACAQLRGLIESIPVFPSTTARQPPVSVLSNAEQDKLEAILSAEDIEFSLGVFLSLYGGLRIGEVCGLRWEDFDFENETIRVRRTVSRIHVTDDTSDAKTKVVITSPKTETSVRTVPLPSPIFSYFKERRKEGSIYVATGTEKYMEPRLCRARYKRLLRRAGIADHSWHCLRHTFATRCIESNVDFKSLSEIMGHSDVKITMQRYVHPSIDFKKEQVNKLSCFLVSGQ